MARKRAMADAVPSDERDDKARRPASPVPSGAGGGRCMTALASLERAPPCRRSAALSCSPGASRATVPRWQAGPLGRLRVPGRVPRLALDPCERSLYARVLGPGLRRVPPFSSLTQPRPLGDCFEVALWRRVRDSTLRGLVASPPSESGGLRLGSACQQDMAATAAGRDAWRGSERWPMRCHRMSEMTKPGARPAPSLRARAAGVA
jgi:hypothetical protein